MNWPNRAIATDGFHAERQVSQLIQLRRAGAGRGVESKLEDSFRDLIERGVTSITTYHEAGESVEAFAALRLEAAALSDAATRLEQACVANGDSFLATLRIKVQLMYGATIAERLMVTFKCGCGPAGRPRSRRTLCD
jgi:hypothetical protein